MTEKKFEIERFLRGYIQGKSFSVMGLPVQFASLKGKENKVSENRSTMHGVFIDPLKTKYLVKFTVDIPTENVLFAKVCEINDECVAGRSLPSLAINEKAKPTVVIRNAAKRVVSSFLKSADLMEIGDGLTSVKVDPERDLQRSHGLVGKTIRVNRNAMGALKGKAGAEGKVTGVFMRNNQIIGLAIKLQDDQEYYAPEKDVNYPI